MTSTLPFVVFAIQSQRYAVPLPVVEQVVAAGAIRRLRDAPFPLAGLIDLGGDGVPVLDVRPDGCRERPVRPEDLFLIVADGPRRAVVLVDAVEGVWSPEPGSVQPLGERIRHEGGPVASWQHLGELILIHDIGSLLTGAVIAAVRAATAETP